MPKFMRIRTDLGSTMESVIVEKWAVVLIFCMNIFSKVLNTVIFVDCSFTATYVQKRKISLNCVLVMVYLDCNS